jgi:hypothetical protein
VFLDESGECWTFQNPDIRIQKNYTFWRKNISDLESQTNIDKSMG